MRRCFTKYQQENVFAALLRKCRDIETGRSVHSQISDSGLLDSSTYLGNLLVQMYGGLSSLTDACSVFNRITHRNVFSWNILLAVYVQNGWFSAAIRLFMEMDLQGEAEPNEFTYATVIGACSSAGALQAGIWIHGCIVERGLESDVFVGTELINMYGNCWRLECAWKSFDSITEKDLVAWNAMLTAFTRNGLFGSIQAVWLFVRMNHEGVQPDSCTFLGVISACANLESLHLGVRIHERILASGMEQGESIQNALVNLYSKCGSVSKAKEVFDRIQEKDIFSWTAIISGLVQAGRRHDAMQLFLEMDLEGVQPQLPTFAVIPSACITLSQSREVHACISEAGLEQDVVVGTALLKMYVSLLNLEAARMIFDRMTVKDVVAWNALLVGYVEQPSQLLYHQMDLEGMKPDEQTYMSRIEACSLAGDLSTGRKLHRRLALSGFQCDETLTSLINMYSRCGSLDEARIVFEELRVRNVIAWTALISACAQNGRHRFGLEHFQLMEAEGVEPDVAAFATVIASCSRLEDIKHFHSRVSSLKLSDREKLVVGTSLVAQYGSCGSPDDAVRVFNSIPSRDSVAFNALSTAYVENEMHGEAIAVYRDMEEPTLVTIVNAITSCTSSGDFTQGKMIHARLDETYEHLYPVVVAALVNMYARSGSLNQAKALFDESSHKRTVASWNSIVAAYAQHVQVEQSLEYFMEMQLSGWLPDKLTYTNILQACSHSGMVREGQRCFSCMGMDHGLIPVFEHYACMVDMLGRVGQLEAAEGLIRCLPFEPDVAVWNSLLAACKLQGDTPRGERSADCAIHLGVEQTAPYLLLASLYASTGDCTSFVYFANFDV